MYYYFPNPTTGKFDVMVTDGKFHYYVTSYTNETDASNFCRDNNK